LKDLPQGLDRTFIRSLKKIDALPLSTRERQKRVLRWVACAAGPIRLVDLMEAVAIDEMADTWDPERVVNDGQSLINDCTDLVITYDDAKWSNLPVVQLIHPSVYDFLTRNPVFFGTTLPQYHVYPLEQAHASLARDCLQYLTTLSRGTIHNYYIVRSWQDHARESGKLSEILSNTFKSRAAPNPTSRWIIFPNVTHVKFIRCTFAMVDEQFNVSLNPSDADSGFPAPFFSMGEMFPKFNHGTFEGCTFDIDVGDQVNTCHSLTRADFATAMFWSVDPLRATHVTVTGLWFVTVRKTQFDIFLSDSTMITHPPHPPYAWSAGPTLHLNGPTFKYFSGSRQCNIATFSVVYDLGSHLLITKW
jgi:hypothetical protein